MIFSFPMHCAFGSTPLHLQGGPLSHSAKAILKVGPLCNPECVCVCVHVCMMCWVTESLVLCLVLRPTSNISFISLPPSRVAAQQASPPSYPSPRTAIHAHRAPVGEHAAGRPPSSHGPNTMTQPHGLENQYSTDGVDRGQTAL